MPAAPAKPRQAAMGIKKLRQRIDFYWDEAARAELVGRGLLYIAARFGSLGAAKLLVEAGADVSSLTSERRSPPA